MPLARCQKCGSPLEAKILGGICPACLWSDLLIDEEDEREHHADGLIIEGHEVFEEIGQGGMGLVYRARQENPSREVALKIVAPYTLRAEEARQRFFMEIEAMAAIEHPAVLPLYQSGEDALGRPWLSMQLLRGGSLADNLASYQGHWQKSVQLVAQLCDAIAYAHEHGLLHRDLKPANVLFDEKGNPFVADFGLAKWAEGDSDLSQTSYLLGSPAYLAPEAAEGGSKLTTTVSDVYGLGAILYELLTGTRPYEGDSANEILTKIISGSPPPPRRIAAKVPRDLDVVVLKAMSRNPEQRYHSAKALRDDLLRWMDGRPILARPMAAPERLWLWTKRNPALATLSCLLIASLITGGLLLGIKNRELNSALNDAEDRVDFMVRDLPAQLAPIGRLEVLDSVFEDVAHHYQNPARRNSESLARHADFQTQWSQILRHRALIDDSRKHLERALFLAKKASEKHSGPLSLSIVRARVAAGWRLGEVLIEDQEFERAESVLNETKAFLDSQSNRYPDDLRLAHLEAGLALEQVILLTETQQAPLALQSYPQVEALWEDFRRRLEQEPQGPEADQFRVESARVPFFLFLIHRKLENIPERESAANEYFSRTAQLLEENQDNLTFITEHFTAHLVRAVFHLDFGVENGPEITDQLQSVDERSQQIYAQDPGNVKWATNSVHIAITLAKLFEKGGEEANFDRWLTIVDERLRKLYQLPNSDIESLRARVDASLFLCQNPNGRDWNWLQSHYRELLSLQMVVCRQTKELRSFHNLRILIRYYTDELVQREETSSALTWLTEFSSTLERERQALGLSSREIGWWHLVLAFSWGQRDQLGEEGARQQASSHLLQALEQAEALLPHSYLRPKNRAEFFNNLLTASTDRSLGQDLATDTHLARILSSGISSLEEEERIDASKRLKQAHLLPDGSYRLGYEILVTLDPEQQ